MIYRPFLISPPFGRYFHHKLAHSVLGSYTAYPRRGRLKQVIRTVRPVYGGWINNIGLRNPGMYSIITGIDGNKIVSLAPLEKLDWYKIKYWRETRNYDENIELNISCPNVDECPDLPDKEFWCGLLCHCQSNSIMVKLPPSDLAISVALDLAAYGIKLFHLSNTLKTPYGGLSGDLLREINLPLVETAAKLFQGTGVRIYAGGGIYNLHHLGQYIDAGATGFSLATAFFWPPRAFKILSQYQRNYYGKIKV